jgi:CMP-N,N'-diacetyllegionaminic acid synthase
MEEAMPEMLCAIPARAGSKRLPGKNLADLGGKPMIAYSIEAAIKSGLFREVVVCTEDRAIADAALSFGAAVPELVPEDLCGDLVASHVPCQRIAKVLNGAGRSYDSIAVLQPTSPLRSIADIEACVRRFGAGDADFLVSVTPVDPHYFHWVVVPEGDYWKMYFGSQFMKERPLLPPVFRPNGSIKIARLGRLAEVGNFFGPRLVTVETPEERSVHVAIRDDLDLCTFYLDRSAR